MEQWLDLITDWLNANPEWLGLAILLVAFLECLAIAGLLVPGTVMLFTVGFLAGSGSVTLWQALLMAYIGGVLGDVLSYGLGRYFQTGIPRLPVLRRHPEWLVSGQLYFERYGMVSLAVGRFIGPLRPILPMVAGMLNMPFARFLALSLAVSVAWSIAYILPGWAAGAALRQPMGEDFWIQTAEIIIPLGLVIFAAGYACLRHKHYASLLAAVGSLLLLICLSFSLPHLQDFDEGLIKLVQSQRYVTLDGISVWVTRLGDFRTQFAAGALLFVVLLLARAWRPAVFAALALGGTALCNQLMKFTFTRARPEVLLEPLSTFSFPSGHSSASFAFFMVLGVLAGRRQSGRVQLIWLLIAVVPAIIIAFSRVYLGVHWPTDILGGALLAAAICAFALTLSQWRQGQLPPLSARLWLVIALSSLLLLIGMASWQYSLAIERYGY